MLDLSQDILLTKQLVPHGNCYLWQAKLVGLHAISDGLIALAYYALPFSIAYLLINRQDLPFRNIFFLFVAFIISCGTTHFMEVVTLWYPWYWVSGALKAMTALISIYTVVELVPLIPSILALPSPAQLEGINEQLKAEIKERKQAEAQVRKLNRDLEKRVQERTLALTKSEQFIQSIADTNPNVLYIYDLQKACFTYVSRSLKKLLGYAPEVITEGSENPINWMVHPDHQQRLHQYYQNCIHLKDGEVSEIEYQALNSNKQWRWLTNRSTVFSRTETGKTWQIVGTTADITEHKNTEANLQKMNEKLKKWVNELEQRNQDMELLAQMNEFLQSCVNVEEAKNAIAHLLEPLFKNCSGAVFLKNSSESLVEAVAQWGGKIYSKLTFPPNECWGLRRIRPHGGDSKKPGLFCSHITRNPAPTSSLCLPLMAQGETLGVFYLDTHENQYLSTSKRQLARNVSEQIALALANLQLREELQHQSIRDGLTGLYNRRYLEESLKREIDRSQRSQTPLGIIMLDIDHFKRFNDTWGHEVGDRVLREVGCFLRENLRNSDIACRYGGEEFTLIVPECSLPNLSQRADSLRQEIKKIRLEHHQQLLPEITISLGVAVCPQHGNSVESLIRTVDAALYEAKREGRDRVVIAKIN